MIGVLSKIFGGNKSEKDVKKITPQVGKINHFFTQFQSLGNDELRAKTSEFKQRIQEQLWRRVEPQFRGGDRKSEQFNAKRVVSLGGTTSS